MKIAEASRQTGLSIDTLRYYDRIGLVSPRRIGSHRSYAHAEIEELQIIVRLRALGMSLDEVRDLVMMDRRVTLAPRMSPNDLTDAAQIATVVRSHIDRIEQHLQEQEALLEAFRAMQRKLDGLLAHGGLQSEHESDSR